jgi:hypothetical protein
MIFNIPFKTVVVVLTMLALSSYSFLYPASNVAYAHTFSTNESAQFLSLVNQIRAEMALVSMNLENNNVTLAQAHAEKAADILDNFTISELRERNERIADGIVTGLEQIEANVTSLASPDSQPEASEERIQSINDAIMSLHDIIAEAITARVEPEHQNNATTWALVTADLVNTVLTDYGNATGSFDLNDMSNLAGMEGMDHGNMTSMNEMEMSGNTSAGVDTLAMMTDNSTSSMNNMGATPIVDEAAYQSALYLSNNTILELFTDTLKPLTLSPNQTSSDTVNDTSSTATNTTSNIDELEGLLIQYRDSISNKAAPMEVMTTAHLGIHPFLMQIYGLTIATNGVGAEDNSEHMETMDHGNMTSMEGMEMGERPDFVSSE